MMQPWFGDAELGIFIHWGIASRGDRSELWAFLGGQVPCEEYLAQAADCAAERCDAEAWAALSAEAGARSAVRYSGHGEAVTCNA